MKKIRLLTKSLLFLSFFLPFVFVPRCDDSARYRAEFLKDSLTKDSIIKDSLEKVKAYSKNKIQHKIDSINGVLDIVKEKEPEPLSSSIDSDKITYDTTMSILNQKSEEFKENNFSAFFKKASGTLLCPTDDSFSGFAIVILMAYAPFGGDHFSLSMLLSFILPIGYIVILYTLIAQFLKIKLKIHFYLSILSLFTIVYILLRAIFTAELNDVLWGFFTTLILNLLDILVIYVSMKKEKVTKNTQFVES